MKNTIQDRQEKKNWSNRLTSMARRSNAEDKERASRAVRRATRKDPENADGRPRAHSDRWGFLKDVNIKQW